VLPNGLWIAFVVIQLLDGVMTLQGIATFGQHIEANPIIAFYASVFTPEAAVTSSKLLAIGCGAILHLTGRHKAVAALCGFYLVAAIAPWTQLLMQSAL
jgi:hypothetical protein